MELIKCSIDNCNLKNNGLVATIGQFDGIHIAHQILIEKVCELSEEKELKSAVITFDPHPDLVLKKDANATSIMTLDEKAALIASMGIDYLIVVEFNQNVANMTDSEFVNQFLIKLNVKEIVVGFDFCFGKNGIGKAETISKLANGKINTTIIDNKTYQNEKIGTAMIKKMLLQGNVSLANKLLGRYYKISGEVKKGNQVGSTINFPTANIEIGENDTKIKLGVYASRILIDGNYYYGFSNYGNNPSFNKRDHFILETNIFNFDGNLYGKYITIELIDFIRDERCFNSKDEFLAQIAKDKEVAMAICQKEFK